EERDKDMSSITKRLDVHFAACAAAAAAAGVAQKSEAAIVYSGPVSINVPSTTAGIYMNVVTGVFATTPGAVAGWDLNPWSSSGLSLWTNNGANPASTDGVVQNFTGGISATAN